jgi:hypothetical protein
MTGALIAIGMVAAVTIFIGLAVLAVYGPLITYADRRFEEDDQ